MKKSSPLFPMKSSQRQQKYYTCKTYAKDSLFQQPMKHYKITSINTKSTPASHCGKNYIAIPVHPIHDIYDIPGDNNVIAPAGLPLRIYHRTPHREKNKLLSLYISQTKIQKTIPTNTLPFTRFTLLLLLGASPLRPGFLRRNR